jgi:hypothetical protein
MNLQDIINFIPTGIAICFFLAFLKTNKNIKRLKAGSFEYETKDEAAPNHIKDAEQDNGIRTLFERVKNIETILEKDAIERKKRQTEIDSRFDKIDLYNKENVIKSCSALVFSDKTPLIEFYDAAFLSIYLGSNGNTIDEVVKRNLADKANLSHYKSSLSKFRKEHEEYNQHFENAIKIIYDRWH